ncbi:MAG: Appr-1-p processing protein [Gemmatimonadetes bacterium]|nr:MAG: Appr-1-p processing protein [Gemmatimonadota bacterium]
MPDSLVIREGDLTTFDGDAVVNAANNHLVLGAGVAGAIARRGGPAVQRACDAHVREHGPIRVGEAVLTPAGDLPARWVIHAAAMGDEPASARSIREATRSALELARAHGLESVAFPVLGTGVAGFDFDEAASIMLVEIRRALDAEGAPSTVVLYGFLPEQAACLRELAGAAPAP